jgi:hypothetical protein
MQPQHENTSIENAQWPEVFKPSGPFDIWHRFTNHHIVIPNVSEVGAYLVKHADLAALLPDICGEARHALGAGVELSLELYKDPEIADCYLTLYVRMEKYEPDILDRLHAVSEAFNQRLEDIPGYFLLATDFARPRGNHAV